MPRWPQSVKSEDDPPSADAGQEDAFASEEGAIHFRLQVPPLGYEQWFALQSTLSLPLPKEEGKQRGAVRAALVLVLLMVLAGLVVVLLLRHAVSAGVFIVIDDRMTMLGGWWFAALVGTLLLGGWAISAVPGISLGFRIHRAHFDATGRFHVPQEVLLCDNGIVVANTYERIFTRWEAVGHRQRGEDYTWFLFTQPGGLIWLPEASIMASRDPDGVRAMAQLK